MPYRYDEISKSAKRRVRSCSSSMHSIKSRHDFHVERATAGRSTVPSTGHVAIRSRVVSSNQPAGLYLNQPSEKYARDCSTYSRAGATNGGVEGTAPEGAGGRQRREGPTGLDVSGARPTSPKGWNAMMQTLRDANVRKGGGV